MERGKQYIPSPGFTWPLKSDLHKSLGATVELEGKPRCAIQRLRFGMEIIPWHLKISKMGDQRISSRLGGAMDNLEDLFTTRGGVFVSYI